MPDTNNLLGLLDPLRQPEPPRNNLMGLLSPLGFGALSKGTLDDIFRNPQMLESFQRLPPIIQMGLLDKVERNRLRLAASGELGGEMSQGGGMIGYEFPAGRNTTLTPMLSGGGARGTVSNPYGRFKVNEGEGALNLEFMKRLNLL